MHPLPPLAYDYDALEPHIDERTMRIHHSKHHQAYVNNLNKTLEGHPDLEAMPVQELLWSLDDVPEEIRAAVRNFGGGHANHSTFWEIMSPDGGGEPSGALRDAIDATFGGFENFKSEFLPAATKVFGSGWTWLTLDENNVLRVESTLNQDSPLSASRMPLMVVDVWEHAYYLKYQNLRGDYLAAWWNTVSWRAVAERYANAFG